MKFCGCWVIHPSKSSICTSLMKTLTRSSQMASCKQEATYSHNKCRTAWKWVLVLPETVEIKIICIKVQKRLRGITWAMRLQHRRAGGNDSGLAWGVDCFELELGAHPEAAMRPSMSHYLHLWDGNMGKYLTQTNHFFNALSPQNSAALNQKERFVPSVWRSIEQGEIWEASAREKML